MNLKGIMKSLNVKPGQVVSDPYARAFAPQVNEADGKDHEVSMAKGSLEAIVKHANELIQKLGEGEKDIPGWIQDHIAKSENFIQQANDQYHEYGKNESVINERKYYVTYNKGRGRGKDLEMDTKTRKPITFNSYSDAKKYAEKMEKMFQHSIGGGTAYWVSDEKMNRIEESLNEAKYSLMSGYLGNGLTYWNAEEQDESGDYKKVAHIDKGGKLTVYDKSLPSDIKKFLDIQADALKRGVRPGIF